MAVFRVVPAYLCVLPMLSLASIRQAPSIPAGFEKSDQAYVSQELGRSVTVRASGAAIRTAVNEIRLDLAGSAANARLDGAGDAGIRNELIGNDRSKWRLGIQLNDRVTAHAVYPGVDVVWYGRGSNLEYDFNLLPHADPRKIRVHISGADRVRLDASNNLVISDGRGVIIQRLPYAYQTIAGVRRPIPARFVLVAENTFSVEVGQYDRSKPLTIDPALQLSNFLGGIGQDEAHAVAVDTSNNFYVAGLTYSTTIGNSNVLLLKIPASGTAVRTVLGGTLGNDFANGITTDSSGNVYVAGGTSSSDFPVVGPLAIQSETNIVAQAAFVVALGSNLTSVGYSAFFGGSGTDEAYGVAVGPGDLLYIVGDTTSIDFLNSTDAGVLINTNAFQYSNHGGYDGFLVSLSTTEGLFNFATYIGGSGDDHAYGVAVDANSFVYVVGQTLSTDFPTYPDTTEQATAFQSYQGNGDAFAIKLESLATEETYGSTGVAWSIYLGGTGEDAANAVALDSSSNVYIAGTTASSDFPVGGGGYQTVYQGTVSNGFIFALNADGLQGLWATYLGSNTEDVINAIALDTAGDVYVTGASDGSNYPVTSDATQSSLAGTQNAIVTELNSAGSTLLFSTYLGGSGSDVGRGIALDSQGDIYLAGITSSTNFPVTSNAFQSTYGGGTSDAFLSILGCSTGVPAIAPGGIGNAASYSTTALSPGGIFAIFGSYFSCAATPATTIPLPTTLNGVSVQVNGTNIPLYYASEGQINAQLPFDIPDGSATITVTAAGGTSAASTLPVEAAGPGIFVIGSQAAALNYPSGALNTTTNGAAPGSYVIVFFTGTGPVSNPPATGAAAAGVSRATEPFSATLDGQSAVVSFLGLAPGFVGLGQANIQIPSSMQAGNYPLIITINGVASNSAVITVSN